MLRRLLLFVTVLAGLGGAAALLAGHEDGLPWAAWGGALTVAVLLERWRYGGRPASEAGDWQPTAERFVDPESGQPMQVLFNSRTGERRYEVVPPERDARP
ncbi:MAG: hypothetical protein EKK53_27510 [Burkholderiales bacterium]|nr:MAG: hypothetical protein EKK53_27510 [Burkholderiales bacterium]